MNARFPAAACVVLSLVCGCTCRSSNSRPDGKQTKMVADVEVRPLPIPVGRQVTMNAHVEVVWTIATDGSSGEGGVGTIGRRYARSATSLATVLERGKEPTEARLVRVQYSSAVTQHESNGTVGAAPDVLSGRSLRLSLASDGSVAVADSSGAPLSAEMVDEVRGDYVEVGRPHSLLASFPPGALTTGEKVGYLDEFIRRQVDGQLAATVFPSGQFKYGTASHVRSMTTDSVSFELDVQTLAADGGWMEPSLRLQGALVVRAPHGWPLSLTLKGKARCAFATLGGVQTHDGSIALEIRWAYES